MDPMECKSNLMTPDFPSRGQRIAWWQAVSFNMAEVRGLTDSAGCAYCGGKGVVALN